MKNTRTLWRAFSIAAILTLTGFTLMACENILSPTNVHNCTQDGCRGEWVVTRPATETEPGEETRTCTECGQTETRPIPPTGDDTGAECEHDDCDCADCDGATCNCDTPGTGDYCTHDDCDCADCDGTDCNCDTPGTGDYCTRDGCDCADCDGATCNCDTPGTGDCCTHDDCACTDCNGTTCNCDTPGAGDYCTHDGCDCADCDGATCNCDTHYHTHDWGEWTVITPAGEYEDGKERRVCRHCSTYEERILHHTGTAGLTFLRMWAIPSYQVTGGTVSGNVIIPAYRNNVPVVAVNTNALQNRNITGITIGANVTSIGPNAFFLNQLANVIIPDSVTSIGWGAFEAVSNLFLNF